MAKTSIDLQGKDNASRAFQTVSDRLKALRGQIDEINAKGRINLTVSEAGKLKALEREASGLEKTLGSTQSASFDLAGAFRVLGAATAVVKFAQMAGELGQLGESAQRSGLYFEAFSGSSQTAAENLKAMQAATGGALTSVQSMQAASKLLSMGLASNAAELEKVAHMAVMLGGDTRSASEAINEFSLLLANQSILRLDTFGISGARVRERIEELMAANKDLSRETAFMNVVMAEGAAKVKLLEDAGVKAATSTDQLKASVAELKIAIGSLLAMPVKNLQTDLANAANGVAAALQAGSNDPVIRARGLAAQLEMVKSELDSLDPNSIEALSEEFGTSRARAQELQRKITELSVELAKAQAAAEGFGSGGMVAIGALTAEFGRLSTAAQRANAAIVSSDLTDLQKRMLQGQGMANAMGLGTVEGLGVGTPEATKALEDFWAAYNKESSTAVSDYQRQMESAFNALASSVQSKLGGAMRSSIGLGDLRTGGSNEPGKNGAFEDIYRLQAWLDNGSWQETADKLGVTSREMGQRIVTDFQNGIFSPDVQRAVNIDQLISQMQIEKAGEESTKAFAAKIAAAAGVSGGQGSSSLSTAFAEGAQTSVNSDDFKARMGDVGSTAWGWTEGGFIRAARQSTALKDAFMAMAEAAIGAAGAANAVKSAANAGGNP